MENLGNIAIKRVIENVKNTISWMEAHYQYAGPNGAKITDYEDLKKAMTPRDWEVYVFLNRLECTLQI